MVIPLRARMFERCDREASELGTGPLSDTVSVGGFLEEETVENSAFETLQNHKTQMQTGGLKWWSNWELNLDQSKGSQLREGGGLSTHRNLEQQIHRLCGSGG